MTASDRLKWILTSSDTLCLELFLACYGLCWGTWLFTHPNLFERNPGGVYGRMDDLCNIEWVWGIPFFLTGFTRLVSVVWDLPWLRKAVAFWGMMLWLFVAVLFLLSNSQSMAAAERILIVVTSMWIYWRVPAWKRPA